MRLKRCLTSLLMALLCAMVSTSAWAEGTRLRILSPGMEKPSVTHRRALLSTEFPAPADAMGTSGYDIIAIAPPPEAERSSANGINSLGEVVGRFYNFDEEADERLDQQAFKWNPTDGSEILTPLAGQAWAWEINDGGMIAGICMNADDHKRSVRWASATEAPVEVGVLTNPTTGVSGDGSRTYGINNAGSVVGNSDIPNDAGDFIPFHGFVFREGIGMEDLGTFTTNWPQYQNGYSHAYDINDEDTVVGLAGDDSFAYKPFIWEADTGKIMLPVNPDYSDGEWQAVALNNSGLIAGHVITATNQHLPHYWPDRTATPVSIAMPANFPYGEIYGVNESGTMVGIMWSDDTDDAEQHAFVYDHVNGVRDLNDQIDSLEDWTLNFARDINDAGQIVGGGELDGVMRAYVLTPRNGLTIDMTGQGTVIKTPDAEGYAAGTIVQLNAAPEEGWAFSHWTGPVADPASAQTTVTIDADTTIGVVFVQTAINYSLSVQTEGQGSVTKSPDAETYAADTVVQLNATPQPGWTFSTWNGPVADPVSSQTTVTINADTTVTAVFVQEIINYALTVQTEGQGSVTKSPDAETHAAGAVVQLSAVPEPGWMFSTWTGPVADSDSAQTTVTLNADTTVTAVFVESVTHHTLTVQTQGQGGVTKSPDAETYPADTVVQVNAIPEPGWMFSAWTGPVADSDSAQTTVTMNADTTVTAVFVEAAANHTLTVDIDGQGSVTRSPDAATYAADTVVQVNAVPGQGYLFSHWTGPVADTANAQTTVTMNADSTITCVFVPEGDRDNDGIPDDMEQGPDGNNPDYDGNGDQIPDAQQGHVTSTYTADGVHYVCMVVDPGQKFTSVTPIDAAGMNSLPSDVAFEWGLFRFTITGVPAGGNAVVQLILPDDARPDAFYKLGPTSDNTDDHWYDFAYDATSGLGGEIEQNVVTLHFQDGGLGDDDMTANGEITDDGGPAAAAVNTDEQPGTGSDGSGSSSGCFINTLH